MTNTRFPRTAKYGPEWIRQNSIGENTLFYLESLCQIIDVRKDTRNR